MPRRKLKYAFLENNKKRKIAYRNRSKGLVKATEELSVLCGIDCCIIIVNNALGNNDSKHWPSAPDEMNRVIWKYENLPQDMKETNSFNQITFAKHLIEKVDRKGNILSYENRAKEISVLVSRCLDLDVGRGRHGNIFGNFSMEDLLDMGKFIDDELGKVTARLEKLPINDCQPPINVTILPFDLNEAATDEDNVDATTGDDGGVGTSSGRT